MVLYFEVEENNYNAAKQISHHYSPIAKLIYFFCPAKFLLFILLSRINIFLNNLLNLPHQF